LIAHQKWKYELACHTHGTSWDQFAHPDNQARQ